MANLDLSKYGIKDVKEIIHNPSYDVLFAEETKPGLEGFEKGQVTELGAVNVMTGIYTGRSPKDKFFVMNEASKDSVWWTSEEYKNDNKPCSEEAWADLKAKAVNQLSGKRLFVVDTFCGANEATRMKVRFIMEVAWQAHFVTNMFIRPEFRRTVHTYRSIQQIHIVITVIQGPQKTDQPGGIIGTYRFGNNFFGIIRRTQSPGRESPVRSRNIIGFGRAGIHPQQQIDMVFFDRTVIRQG